LEGRLVPATLQVAPAYAANGYTTFATLAQALGKAKSGDTVQVLPGSNPGGGAVTVDNLTLAGDKTAGAIGLLASGTQVGLVDLKNASKVSLIGLAISGVTIEPGSTAETVRDCTFTGTGVAQSFATSGSKAADGGDTVSGCTFLNGAAVRLGNTAGSDAQTAANDHVTDNTFVCAAAAPSGTSFISATNESGGLVISGNTIKYVAGDVLLSAISATDSVGSISGNTIVIPSGAAFVLAGISVSDGGPGDTRPTNLTVGNNAVTSGGGGRGSKAPGSRNSTSSSCPSPATPWPIATTPSTSVATVRAGQATTGTCRRAASTGWRTAPAATTSAATSAARGAPMPSIR
jgi:hypothetical protein